jgi:hypothetical protein
MPTTSAQKHALLANTVEQPQENANHAGLSPTKTQTVSITALLATLEMLPARNVPHAQLSALCVPQLINAQVAAPTTS